jgi:cell division protein FtsW
MRIWASPLEGLGFVTILLFLVGTINVFSASFVLGSQLLGDSLYFLKRHFAATLIGLAGMAFIIRQGYPWFLKRITVWAVLTMALLIAVLVIGVEANGARRWLSIGGLTTFQPSELAKLVGVLAATAYIGPRLDRRTVSLFSYPILITGALAALVTIQPDMGTGMIIIAMCLVPYLVAGISKREWILLGVGGGGGVVLLIWRAAYRAERILAWFNPEGYSQTSGYQPLQSLLAIGSGGLKGTGLGMGASKFYYLPEAHTDFAFAIWAQETGFIGGVVVLLLIGALACYGIRIAMEAVDGRGRILAIGIVFMIVGQAIGNIAMVLSLLPVTGVPMPFFSYGGTALFVNIWAMGFLFSVAVESARRGNKRSDANKPEPAFRSKMRLTERLAQHGR